MQHEFSICNIDYLASNYYLYAILLSCPYLVQDLGLQQLSAKASVLCHIGTCFYDRDDCLPIVALKIENSKIPKEKKNRRLMLSRP